MFLHLTFFINMEIFLLSPYIWLWLCKKWCFMRDVLCWVYKKTNSFLSFNSPMFHSKNHRIHKIHFEMKEGVHLKQTETNKGGGGSKIRSSERIYFLNLLFLSLFAATKVFLISLSCKFCYQLQLLTMAFYILRKFEIINKLFMWQEKIMLKTKTERTTTLESIDFIH